MQLQLFSRLEVILCAFLVENRFVNALVLFSEVGQLNKTREKYPGINFVSVPEVHSATCHQAVLKR
jgi:hypothetical protein